MNGILKSENNNNALATEGYAVVPFLTPEEVNQLTTFFYAHHTALPSGMYASAHAPDFAYRQRMNEKIKDVCARAIDITFKKATPLGATFMVKSAGENGSLHPHQDWNIVDERQFSSYNIWLPLVDVNKDNGTILVLPRSHRMLKNIRGLNIPSSFEKINAQVWPYLTPVNMQAGEALVYDHRLLHASALNNTNTPRLVIVYGIIPAAAQMRYYFGKGEQIEVYSCAPNFYFSEEINNGPASLPLLETINQQTPQVSAAQLQQFAMPYKTLWQRLSDLFDIELPD